MQRSPRTPDRTPGGNETGRKPPCYSERVDDALPCNLVEYGQKQRDAHGAGFSQKRLA